MRKSILFVPILLFLFTATVTASDWQLSEPGWDFGTITSQDQILNRDLVITNTGKQEQQISIIPTCDCLTVSPPAQKIIPGGSGFYRLFYNPHEDSGTVERYYMITSDQANTAVIQFPVKGFVDVGANANTAPQDLTPTGREEKTADLTILYYYMPTCPTCRKFINTGIPALEKKFNCSIKLEKRTIDKPEILKECIARLEKAGVKQQAFPVLIIGEKILQGNEEIDKNIEKEITFALENNVITIIDENLDTESVELKRNFTILPVFLAGLIDGINPCAFATIIMLLSSLALAGKRRKEILVMGLFFTASVFITYYAVGVGIFTAVQAATSFPIVALVIRWALFAALLVFAALSVYDYFKIRAGKADEMVLQLSDFFKKKIKDSIRLHVRSAALAISSLVLGFLVSVFELGCTGQIYFPTIMTMVRVGKEFWGFIFLFIYCIGFIIPLVLVFILTYRGISSQKVMKIFQEKMGAVKLALAALFLALAVLTLIL